MTDSFGISESQLLALFLSSVLWGMLLITSAYCLRYLLWESDERGGKLKAASTIRWLMLAIALVLLTVCTFDIALLLMRAIQAFIFYTGAGGSAAKFIGLTNWVNISESCSVGLGKLISDAILVYRCWIISNRSITLITFPALLWLGEVAIVIFIIFREASQGHNSKVLLTEVAEFQAAITAAWSMSIINNVISTGFIVYRIWRVDNELSSLHADRTRASSGVQFPSLFRRCARKTKLQRVTRIIIESGLLYTTWAFITFIAFLVRSTSFYAISDAELQILSIAFNLIIIRVNTQPSESENYVIHSSLGFALNTSSAATKPTAPNIASSAKMNSFSGLRRSNGELQGDSLLGS